MTSNEPRRAPRARGELTSMAAAAAAIRVTAEPMPEVYEHGLRLQVFDRILPGFGVVAICGDDRGSHLLLNGEVAVYEEGWLDFNELVPGLYCYERQSPIACNPDPTGRRKVERFVVEIMRHPRQPEHWTYREVRSRLHRGRMLHGTTEMSPMYDWGLGEMLLGPIVGLYRPAVQ